ncbi:murein L,D-transpeptidase catalytic domain family protein [Sphingobium phenoxybenzoativorans]|uniref:Murein L,D-transpeptidase catalytic domain family protein n=2 Tax=Sphingobium phenoxybenzoativorans TaxID=1592790 RepID=A0A975K5H1_9SPHN|nr:murein L,D-transpeptidase catalytic domain family protein [Sphingobium phenoxybenzoativorans]QUT05159.1 murein L,D-transpeptidase catalytic domain family protein [Sphingobium phenoxybenzoativorans]
MVPSSLPAMSQRVKPRLRATLGSAKIKAAAGVRPELFAAAMTALDQHGAAIKRHDRIAIADFSLASSKSRLHIVNLSDGRVLNLLVAHGSGSDPDHTGWLKRFSNAFDSNASSRGAFATSDYYVGKHGPSQRLVGLDPTNSNAFDRAIVIHGAWYANADMIATHGKLGRSQGCFAVGEKDLTPLFDHLGKGRLLFAAKA